MKASLIEFMGSDHTVANAARVSFANHEYPEYNDKTGEYDENPRNEKLIRYLAKHRHTSPFGHCFASFHIKAPIFVARQLVKHKFLRFNEISRRYVDSEPTFYYPSIYRGRPVDSKQGSSGEVTCQYDLFNQSVRQHAIASNKLYVYLLKRGVCPEQARMVLPQNMYTEWYWSGSLDAFADMCNLRCKEDTQYETRIIAQNIHDDLSNVWPISWRSLRGDL